MNHAERRKLARKLQMAVHPAETEYVVALRKIFRGLHAAMVDALLTHWRLKSGRLDAMDGAADGVSGLEFAAIEEHFVRQLKVKVGTAFGAMATKLRVDTRALQAIPSIHPSETGLDVIVAQARDTNIRLVEAAGRAYAADVRAVFDDPENWDLSVDELRARLVSRGNVSESRADLIARDQTLKLSSAMARARMLNAGVSEYTWSGVLDRRERDSHRELEGQHFSWHGTTPIGYHPGEDYQCRCVPIAYVEELEGL